MKKEEKKAEKKVRELFVEELKRIRGGNNSEFGLSHRPVDPPGGPCPGITTLACGEEAPPCSGC